MTVGWFSVLSRAAKSWHSDYSLLPRRWSGEDVLTRVCGGFNCDTKRSRQLRVHW